MGEKLCVQAHMQFFILEICTVMLKFQQFTHHNSMLSVKAIYKLIIVLLYLRESGPMGSAPYIGPRLGGGPVFEVSVSHLYAKERPGKLPS